MAACLCEKYRCIAHDTNIVRWRKENLATHPQSFNSMLVLPGPTWYSCWKRLTFFEHVFRHYLSCHLNWAKELRESREVKWFRDTTLTRKHRWRQWWGCSIVIYIYFLYFWGLLQFVDAFSLYENNHSQRCKARFMWLEVFFCFIKTLPEWTKIHFCNFKYGSV